MIVDRLAEIIREAMTEAKLLELHNCEQLWRGTAGRGSVLIQASKQANSRNKTQVPKQAQTNCLLACPHTCTGSILEVPLETR